MGQFVKINFDNMENYGLNNSEGIVLEYIDSLCKNGNREYCFASNKTISKTTKISERTLYRILSKLESKGLIKRKTKSIGKEGKERRIFSNLPSAKVADIYR
jgi:DNA-binding PadR family transcriptional regulator